MPALASGWDGPTRDAEIAGEHPATSLFVGSTEVAGRLPAVPRSVRIGETFFLLGEGVVNIALLVCRACSRAEPTGGLALEDTRVSDAPFAFSKRSMTFRTVVDATRMGTLPARLRLACRLVGRGCDVNAESGAAAVFGDAAAANSGVAGTVTASAIIAQVPRQRGHNLTADNLSLDA